MLKVPMVVVNLFDVKLFLGLSYIVFYKLSIFLLIFIIISFSNIFTSFIMGKSRPSASRKIKQNNFVRRRKERKLTLALEQLEEYQHAFMSTHEVSSRRKEEIEKVQKELQAAEEKKKELVEYYERLIKITVDEREDSLLA